MTSQHNFPVFKLPFLCLQDVLYNFSVTDLTTYSLLSKKCSRTVKTLQYFRFIRLLIYITKDVLDINFAENRNNQRRVLETWRFEFQETDKPFTIYIEGGTRTETDWLNRNSYPFLNADPVQSIKNSIQFFIDFIGVDFADLSCGPDGARSSLSHFNQLDIRTCEYFNIDSPDPLKNEQDLNTFLQTTAATDLAIFNISAGPNFVFNPNICSAPEIVFSERSGEWMTRQVLFGLKSDTIIAFNCDSSKVTGMDFMHFVNEWFYSESESDVYAQFRHLSMTWNGDGYGHIDEDYWRWFRPQPWQEHRRGRYIPYTLNQKIDASEGWDIKRFAVRATVLIKPKSLHFHVWHEPFPDFSARKLVE